LLGERRHGRRIGALNLLLEGFGRDVGHADSLNGLVFGEPGVFARLHSAGRSAPTSIVLVLRLFKLPQQLSAAPDRPSLSVVKMTGYSTRAALPLGEESAVRIAPGGKVHDQRFEPSGEEIRAGVNYGDTMSQRRTSPESFVVGMQSDATVYIPRN
jgi:hypothetical protein